MTLKMLIHKDMHRTVSGVGALKVVKQLRDLELCMHGQLLHHLSTHTERPEKLP